MSVFSDTKIAVVPTHMNSNPLGNFGGSPNINYKSSYSVSDITQCYAAQRTITGTSEDLDLTTGLLDDFGATITLTSLKLLCIVNLDATAVLTIGGGSNPALGSGLLIVGAGKCIYTDSVFAISGTAKTLHVASTASGTIYQVLILGA